MNNWETGVQCTDKVEEITRKSKMLHPVLFDLLSQPTPHGSEKLLFPYMPFITRKDLIGHCDGKGNLIVDVGKPKSDFYTVFSSHMDTVHTEKYKERKINLFMTMAGKGVKTEEAGMVYAGEWFMSKSNKDLYVTPCVLGADDKLGVYIMSMMIMKNIPGRYIFHVGEERGCIGAHYIADHKPDPLKGMKRAIAFDRANYGDVIAHQHGERGSSTKFSSALAAALNEHLPAKQKFTSDIHGVFTDTGCYHKLVPECCNLSVGYFNQHGPSEHFDAIWLEGMLLPAILKIKWEDLPTERDNTKTTVTTYGESWFRGNNSNRNYNSTQKVKYEDITLTTDTWKCPDYKITEGYITQCSREGMIVLVKKYLGDIATSYQTRTVDATHIVDILAKLNNLEIENASLKKAVESKVTAPRFKMAYKCGLIDNLDRVWSMLCGKGRLLEKIKPEERVRAHEVARILKEFYHQERYLDLRLGLSFDDEANKKINNLILQLASAISYFKPYGDKKLNRYLGDLVQYMCVNPDEPVFVDFKDKLKEYPEGLRNKARQKGVTTKPDNDNKKYEKKFEPCSACQGTGASHSGASFCYACGGDGQKKIVSAVDLGKTISQATETKPQEALADDPLKQRQANEVDIGNTTPTIH